MKERPILFSAPMVRALLDGTKTQTRRLVKMKPHHQIEQRDDGSNWPWMYDGARDADWWMPCPHGQPGDRLWVRETWAYGIHALAAARDENGPFVYAADGTTQGRLCDRWRPSIHMPRTASRITLEITGVRVERLQDISNDDAYSEGTGTWAAETAKDGNKWPSMPRAFRGLWESINGAESWATNPWVWAIDFKRLEQPA